MTGLACLGSTSWAGLYQGGVGVPEASATFTGELLWHRDGVPDQICETTADVSFEEVGGGVSVKVIGFNLSGTLICGLMTAVNLPWHGFVSGATIPADPSVSIPISLSEIGLNLCGSIYNADVNFNNGGGPGSVINSYPSYLEMNAQNVGPCTLSFTLETDLTEDVDVR